MVDQLRDIAILSTMALLFVLTLQVMALTRPHGDEERGRRR